MTKEQDTDDVQETVTEILKKQLWVAEKSTTVIDGAEKAEVRRALVDAVDTFESGLESDDRLEQVYALAYNFAVKVEDVDAAREIASRSNRIQFPDDE